MKEEKVIDYEVEDSKPVEDLGGNTGSGNADADDCNISAYYAIAAVLAVILFVIAILLFTNLK